MRVMWFVGLLQPPLSGDQIRQTPQVGNLTYCSPLHDLQDLSRIYWPRKSNDTSVEKRHQKTSNEMIDGNAHMGEFSTNLSCILQRIGMHDGNQLLFHLLARHPRWTSSVRRAFDKHGYVCVNDFMI
jgi:hypothetical protein